MLIEIHMIQNHSPANLNRDDLGTPKTCLFGGAMRARISSQCLKRSIRRSDEFAAALEAAGGVRTRKMANLLARVANSEVLDLTPKKLIQFLQESPDENAKFQELEALAKEALLLGGVKQKSNDESAETLSKMLLFLSSATIGKMANDLRTASKAKDLALIFKKYISEKPTVPDIALNGRMTEVEKKSIFSDLNFKVEAALSTAHAISTHAVINEVDYFTAVDDVPGEGAAYLDEAQFNSACFYKHFVIDFKQLKENLTNNPDLCLTTVKCFLEAATMANPSGKQHSFAAFNPPEGVLVEVKTQSATPISYANAFADPVPERPERGLIGESIARLGQYAQDLNEGYGIQAERFWFSPNLRHRLTCIKETEETEGKQVNKEGEDKVKKRKEEKSVVGSNEFGGFNQFVETVMKTVRETANSEEAAK